MGLRLVNTAPGEVVAPVKPGQPIHMGLRSETLSVQLSTLNLDVGVSSMIHGGVLPEVDPNLTNIGVTTSLETSERRRPATSSLSRTISAGNLVLTKNTNSLDEAGIYELKIPINPAHSVLGHFKFRKKTAWVTYNPDWCNLTNMTGMHFGLEHGGFNTAAYAFLRDDGGTGSIVFAGPLQSISTLRPGQTQLAYPWMALANDAILELFIFINTYVSPFRAELWTKTALDAAPVFLGSVPLGSLGTFPTSIFSNARPGVSETATLFFGNIGKTGDILQLDDWALYPDYRAAVRAGSPRAGHSLLVSPDGPVEYRSAGAVLPTDLPVARWFLETGGAYLPPALSLFYTPGRYTKPRYLSLPKSGYGNTALKRIEPRLEALQDGFVVETFWAGTSTTKFGNLVGPGLVVNDGQSSYKLMMLETPLMKSVGIASDDALFSDASSYYTAASEVDWTTLKLMRMTVDRRRSRVLLHVDESKILDLPLNAPAQLNTNELTVPTTALAGTALEVEISTDGGGTWAPRSHVFLANYDDTAALVSILTANAVLIGAGPTQISVLDRGTSLAIRTAQTGPLMGLRFGAGTTCNGVGKLSLTIPGTALGATTAFPPAPNTIGKVQIGHPYAADYAAELKLDTVSYLPRYLAWEGEDSLFPDSSGLDSAVRFTLSALGGGGQTVSPAGVSIVKTGFLSNAEYRYFKKAQNFNSLGGVQADFAVNVIEYTDEHGQVSAANTAMSAGLTLFLGNKRVFFGFFDCGAHGRKVGIIPGSGSEADILNQTALGKSFSASADWSLFNRYRIVVRPNDSIQVWMGTVIGEPAIRIPWRNAVEGFDLPLDATSPAIAFGHFDNFLTISSSSTTLWKYVRWGYSNGYDIALQQLYPDGYPKYLFGGREFVLSEFDES